LSKVSKLLLNSINPLPPALSVIPKTPTSSTSLCQYVYRIKVKKLNDFWAPLSRGAVRRTEGF